MKIKTRFAPSPTGYLHIGGIRTALYSWLFARSMGGKFILRIEDTDAKRSKKQSITDIIDSMKWLNLMWDEGPYFQTERLDRYNAIINEMLSLKMAYKCYCSKERLQKLRKLQIALHQKPCYDRLCRDRSDYSNTKNAFVVRFSNPKEGSVVFNDLIRGPIKFNNCELDDLIIRRADGIPTYNFCVAIDDYDMSITHVIRGEDHINNTPRQINILKALQAPVPSYAHLSTVLDNSGKKLSKRNGAQGVGQYRKNGFLPESLLNYVLRLGWSRGNQEIFSIDEMKRLFNFRSISRSSSEFNSEKLLWFNRYYIKHLPINYIAKHLVWHIEREAVNTRLGPRLETLVELLRTRCKTLKEMVTNYRYFYEDFNQFDTDAVQHLSLKTIPILRLIQSQLNTLIEWTPNSVRSAIEKAAKALHISIGEVSMPLRAAVTGTSQSPSIAATVYIIGQTKSITRISLALKFIEKNNKTSLTLT